MRTTVGELHSKPIERIIQDYNVKHPENKPTPSCDNYLNGIYKFRYFMESEYNPPTFSYMIP